MAKGGIEDAGKNLMVSANDQIFGADNYRPLVMAERNGRPVQLGAIAKVIDGTEEHAPGRVVSTRDRAVLLPVMKQSDANVISVVDEIHGAAAAGSKMAATRVEISILSDRTQTIRASVHDVPFTAYSSPSRWSSSSWHFSCGVSGRPS